MKIFLGKITCSDTTRPNSLRQEKSKYIKDTAYNNFQQVISTQFKSKNGISQKLGLFVFLKCFLLVFDGYREIRSRTEGSALKGFKSGPVKPLIIWAPVNHS